MSRKLSYSFMQALFVLLKLSKAKCNREDKNAKENPIKKIYYPEWHIDNNAISVCAVPSTLIDRWSDKGTSTGRRK